MRRILFILAIAGAIAAIQAVPAMATASGRCNPVYGIAKTPDHLIVNWKHESVFSEAASVAQSAGYRPVDGGFGHWLRHRVIRPKLAHSASIINYGCSGGSLFGAGSKLLNKGDRQFVALPAKYSKKEVRVNNPGKGWKRKVVQMHFVAQASCSNPGKHRVPVVIWVRIPKAPIYLVKNAIDADGADMDVNDIRVKPGTFTFTVEFGGNSHSTVYNQFIRDRQKVGTCIVGQLVTVSEKYLGGWDIVENPEGKKNPQEKTCAKGGITFIFVNQLCPPDVSVSLRKFARKDGHNVRLHGGEFSFKLFNDGVYQGKIFTNKGGGRTKLLDTVARGAKIKVCEVREPKGSPWRHYTPKNWCSSEKIAGDTPLIFTFKNIYRR